MKMMGMCAVCLLVLIPRQTSNPSMPGMTASKRIRSGVTFFRRPTAVAPSMAASAVISAPSSAAVMKPRESGESSTTSTTSRRPALPLIITERLQIIDDFTEAEIAQHFAHGRNRRSGLGLLALQFVEPRGDTRGVADTAEGNDAIDLDAMGDGDHSGRLAQALLR